MNSQLTQEERRQEQQEKIIQQLKKSIQHNHHQLHELVSNQQQFVEKITQFNNLAQEKINQKTQLQISQALVYLIQAQKILQYAAGCGKNINRELIICVLHNQACIYQILWELEQCSNYLEALIYNYETFFKQNISDFSTSPSLVSPSQIHPHTSDQKPFGFAGNSQIQYTSKIRTPNMISKIQLKLATYYYEHCAVSSQLQRNLKALQSSRKAIKLLRNSFQNEQPQLINEMGQHKTYNSQGQNIEEKYRLLVCLSQMSQKLCVQDYKAILKSSHFSIQIWDKNKLHHENFCFQDLQAKTKQFITKNQHGLKELTIGRIMQILPKNFNKFTNQSYSQQGQEIFQIQNYLLRVFFLSVGYFSVATELRLIANTIYRKNQQQKKNSQEYKQSILNHLISIIIACTFIPYECHYIDDILASYQKHYGQNLSEYKPIQLQSVDKIIQLLGFRKQSKISCSVQKKQEEKKQQNQLSNEYKMNCKNKDFKVNLSKKLYNISKNQGQTQKKKTKTNKSKFKTQKSDLKSSRASSKGSKIKRSVSRASVSSKIQAKYTELQKILSSDNLQSSKKSQKRATNAAKSKQPIKAKQKNTKKTQKTKLKQTINIHDKHEKDEKMFKNQKKMRKTKMEKDIKGDHIKQDKNNMMTQDQQIFFYMAKKTTRPQANGHTPVYSPKSPSMTRKSTKKTSLHTSRSSSKHSPNVFGNIYSPTGTIQSPVSKGIKIKRIGNGKDDRKTVKKAEPITSRGYF